MALYDENTTFFQAAVVYPVIGTAAFYVIFYTWLSLCALFDMVRAAIAAARGMK